MEVLWIAFPFIARAAVVWQLYASDAAAAWQLAGWLALVTGVLVDRKAPGLLDALMGTGLAFGGFPVLAATLSLTSSALSVARGPSPARWVWWSPLVAMLWAPEGLDHAALIPPAALVHVFILRLSAALRRTEQLLERERLELSRQARVAEEEADRMKRFREMHAAVLAAVQALASAREQGGLWRALAEHAAQVTGARYAGVYLHRDGSWELESSWSSVRGEVPPLETRLASGVPRELLGDDLAVLVADPVPVYVVCSRKAARVLPARSLNVHTRFDISDHDAVRVLAGLASSLARALR